MLEAAPRCFAPVALCAALMGLATPAQANGDEVYGTRSGSDMSETGHRVELSFERGYVQLVVERTVHNPIERHDQAMFWLSIPSEAVATNLRTLGERNGRPHWYAGELLEAEAAAARYRELTGIGGYYPKDPALLSWRSQGLLALQVFPVAPGTEKTVSYTLKMPATWESGRWHVELPALGSPQMPAEIFLDPAESLDQLFVDGEVVARGHYLVSDHDVSLSLAPRDPAPLSLSLADAPTGKRHLAQWRVTLAPKLSEIPKRARLVVALDLSRSRGPSNIEAQRSLALAYLEHFADAELGATVSLLGFDREVRELAPGFVPVGEAIELLQQAPLVARNGSELGLALLEAAARLGAGQAKPSDRVLVLSDFETAARVTPEAVGAALQLGEGIVHLVDCNDGWAELSREDGATWAPLAARSGGVAWSAGVWNDWQRAEAHEAALATFEELARPLRIDALAVHVDGLDDDRQPYYPDSLPEGEGLEGLDVSPDAATSLRVEGLLWNQILREEVRPSRVESERWSALVFGSGLLYELDEDEMMTLALRGGAVSPVTSYLAIEPGVRPSTEGLEWGARGSGAGFGSGSGMGMAGHHTVMRGAAQPPDKRGWLERELGEGWRRCGGTGTQAQLSLETASAELLDIELSGSTVDTGLRACMEQVTWSIELPDFFDGRETWQLGLS